MQSLTNSGQTDRLRKVWAIEDWISHHTAPPKEPPETLWQRKKSAALAHIRLTHELTRKRLSRILNLSAPKVDRLTAELLEEGAIEEENGCFYPAGTIAARKPLFVPVKALVDVAIIGGGKS